MFSSGTLQASQSGLAGVNGRINIASVKGNATCQLAPGLELPYGQPMELRYPPNGQEATLHIRRQ